MGIIDRKSIIIGTGMFVTGTTVGIIAGKTMLGQDAISKKEHEKIVQDYKDTCEELEAKIKKITDETSKEQVELSKIKKKKETLEKDIEIINAGINSDDNILFMLRLLEEIRRTSSSTRTEYERLYDIMVKNCAYTSKISDDFDKVVKKRNSDNLSVSLSNLIKAGSNII